MDFSSLLLKWYSENARDLPWRSTSDPYRIWVSEVILQQTRVAQGLSYYYRFIERFPNVESLAKAPLDDVMKAWQGLGYYTRARNLQLGAQQVVAEYHGKLPGNYQELLKIKGLGPYSAAAIASFAFGQAVPALDGNVYRVLSRVYGIFTPINTASARKEFFSLASELISPKEPAKFNQAIIDFGAMQCTPKSPACLTCPFSDYCYAYLNNLVSRLPVKEMKNPPRNRYFYYFMLRHDKFTYIRRREERDIWHSLYEFPLIETDQQLTDSELALLIEDSDLFKDSGIKVLHISNPVRHPLSHLTIWATFVIASITRPTYHLKKSFKRVLAVKVQEEYSLPRLIDGFMAAEPVARYFINPK